ncbi:hypothetical protein HNQ93_000872 [Hymenobacter luteus]|uniref:DUF4386 domain-containing protein n=2 Tax=Hymenobacter TaxID=89966 RepID=A0A7W9WBV7_9BACT|nr:MULTISPECIES: DUF4386 domain-containing protein [Hymenobacter]MBB4599648.1 hypothetical protein [Hymenobacter latericoloratus]MBB6058042.1 hypothetical protein [Hymenobacter luteus]
MNTTLRLLPNRYIRLGGIAYLIIIIAGVLGETFVRGTLVVPGDAAATAQRITESPQLWRAGIGGDLLMHLLDVPVMFVLYILLKPVNRGVALMSLLSNVVQTAVLALNKLNLLLPLFLLNKAVYLNALDLAERQALAYVFVRAHNYGFGIGLLFFGVTCLGWGYLIRRSGYLPRVLGTLMQVAGLCYLVNSFALIIAPPVADLLTPFILLPPFVAETALAGWLVVKGATDPARQPHRPELASA